MTLKTNQMEVSRHLTPGEALSKARADAHAPDPATVRLFRTHARLCKQAEALMHSKNHDYRGGGGDPYANFRNSEGFDIHPVVGIMLRMNDKMMRIKTFAEKGELQVKGEGIDDAVIDIINYAVLIRGMIAEDARNADGTEQG